MPGSPTPAPAWGSSSDPYLDAMARLLLALTLVLILAACEEIRMRGSASEHGVRNVKVGVPF